MLGAGLYLAVPVYSLFDPQHPPLSLDSGVGVLMVPLAVQEMVLALWLIVRGFNASAPGPVAAAAADPGRAEIKPLLAER